MSVVTLDAPLNVEENTIRPIMCADRHSHAILDDVAAVNSHQRPGAELLSWLSALRTLSAAATTAADLRHVLDLVADTARTLLGYDFCGVLTPDVAGENLVITGWSGLSADYVSRVNSDRPVRLGSGSPSSRAFHAGQAVAIRDITAEDEFTPWGGVAREQGYRAIVSVPLVAGDEVLGTLNGYYAPVHSFTDHEIERLTLLANHAAIALTSAGRLDQLRQLNESLREQRDALTRSQQIHDRLLAVSLRSGGLSGIAAALAELIGRPVLIDDARNVVLATAGAGSELPDDAWRAAANLDESVASAPVLVDGESGAGFFVSVARLEDDVAARIWFPQRLSALDAVAVRAVEHASIVISLELLRDRTAAEVEHRLRGELLADLLGSGSTVSEQLLQRAQRLGHDLTRQHVAIVGALGSVDEPAETRVYQRSLSLVAALVQPRRPRPLTAMHRGNVVTLWPVDDDGPAAAESVRRAMGSVSSAVDATVSLSPRGADSYAESYRTAKGALDIAMRAGRVNTVVQLEDLGVLGLLLQLDDSAQLVAFATRALGPLLDYDATHHTDLVETLRTHFAGKLDRNGTAAALHIHPNTVTQRLRRIEQLCGVELADPSVALQLSAALMVLDVASV
jgi:sugar diacid utilization regulator